MKEGIKFFTWTITIFLMQGILLTNSVFSQSNSS